MSGAYAVSCNLKNSSVDLVDWLVSTGHNHIGFIKGPDTMMSSMERFNGYVEGLKKITWSGKKAMWLKPI